MALLKKFEAGIVADIRSLPGSKKFPHFDRENMERALPDNGLKYIWLPKLGGLRRVQKGLESPNMGLHESRFSCVRADDGTPEFREGVEELLGPASEAVTVIMCAEALYWRCHRRLLSDYLFAHRIEVLHIMGLNNLIPHKLTQQAVVTPEGDVIYPGVNQT